VACAVVDAGLMTAYWLPGIGGNCFHAGPLPPWPTWGEAAPRAAGQCSMPRVEGNRIDSMKRGIHPPVPFNARRPEKMFSLRAAEVYWQGKSCVMLSPAPTPAGHDRLPSGGTVRQAGNVQKVNVPGRGKTAGGGGKTERKSRKKGSTTANSFCLCARTGLAVSRERSSLTQMCRSVRQKKRIFHRFIYPR